MASGDGSRSLKDASVVLYDISCGPCQTDNLNKQAHHYCNECREYLCNSSKDVHRKLAISKSHTILSGEKIPVRIPGGQSSSCVAYCGCNKNQEVEFYCEDHQDVICNPCRKVKHRKCKTLDVQEKSVDFTPTRFSIMLNKTQSLIHEFVSMQKQRKSDRKELKRLTEECRRKIKEFRAKIDAFLDKLDQTIFQELDEFDHQQTQYIDHYIDELTTGLQMLNAVNQQLKQAKHSANEIKMFTTDTQVSKSLKEYETVLAEMKNDVSKLTLSFEENKKLADLQTEISSLGSLKGTGLTLGLRLKCGKKSNKKIFLGKKAKSRKKVDVISKDDKKHSFITGCTFMPSGHAVLCDSDNETLILLDQNFVLRKHLKVYSGPWDVSVVDDNNVITILLATNKLQYIQVFPQMKTGRTIELDNRGWGIEVFGGEIYTAKMDVSGQVVVQVSDLNGSIKRMLQTTVKLLTPEYIIVSRSGKIFVSGGDTVACFATDGNLVYEYKDSTLKSPKGMYVDAEDNIFVCNYGCDAVQVITSSGKKHGNLLPSIDNFNIAYSIAYRETDDMLLVAFKSQDYVSIYKLV